MNEVELENIQPKVSQDLPMSPAGLDADKLMTGTPSGLNKGLHALSKASLAVKVAKKLVNRKQRTKISPTTKLVVGSLFFWFGGVFIYVISISIASGGIFLVYDYAEGFFYGVLNTFLINRLISYEKKDNRSITYNDYFIYNIVTICTSTLLFPSLNNFLRASDSYLISAKLMVIIGNLILNFVYFYNQKELNGSAAISDIKYVAIHFILALWSVMCCVGSVIMHNLDDYIQNSQYSQSLGIILGYYLTMEAFKYLILLIERKANTYMGESLVLLLTNMTITAIIREALSVSYTLPGYQFLVQAIVIKCVVYKLFFLIIPAMLWDKITARWYRKTLEKQRVSQKTAFEITLNVILFQATDLANMLLFPIFYLICRALGKDASTNTFDPWTQPDISPIYIGFIIELIFEIVLTLFMGILWRVKRYLQNRRTSNAVFTLIRRNVCWILVFNTCIYSYICIQFLYVIQIVT